MVRQRVLRVRFWRHPGATKLRVISSIIRASNGRNGMSIANLGFDGELP
jgi:hypothetical protein